MVSEEKMKIVINNYFKKECSVNTSIREAFEKGFRIGVSKMQKQGEWQLISDEGNRHECNQCKEYAPSFKDGSEHLSKFCPNCGAKMKKD